MRSATLYSVILLASTLLQGQKTEQAQQGDSWAYEDRMFAIRQVAYVSIASNACSDWPLSDAQKERIKKFLDKAANGSFNERTQYNLVVSRVRTAISAKGRLNFCADPVERKGFEKAAATIAPVGPIAKDE